MGEEITISGVSVVLSLVSAIMVAIMFFRKPQEKLKDAVKAMQEKQAVHKEQDDQKFEGLSKDILSVRDSVLYLKANDLHSLCVRQDQFANLIIEQTKEMARISGAQEVIITLLKKGIK